MPLKLSSWIVGYDDCSTLTLPWILSLTLTCVLILDPGYSYTPVTRRERQRNCERQRAHSTSTLAASVGLPCPFSPPGTRDGGGTEWQASERLSLDGIAFPGIPLKSTGDGSKGDAGNTAVYSEVTDRQTRHSLSDRSILEDSEKDLNRGRTYSLEMRGGHSAENTKPVSPVTATPLSQLTEPPHRKDSIPSSLSSSYSSIRHLSSLRISESSLFSSFDQQKPLESSTGLSHEDCDDVFLQNPPPPSPPPPIKETTIMEDFPPPPSPPPPLELEQETVHQTVERFSVQYFFFGWNLNIIMMDLFFIHLLPCSFSVSLIFSPCSEFLNNSSSPTRKSSLSSPPVSPFPFPPPVSSLLPSLTTSTTTEDSLCLEYQPLPKREKTSEELRVELLAQQLVGTCSCCTFVHISANILSHPGCLEVESRQVDFLLVWFCYDLTRRKSDSTLVS